MTESIASTDLPVDRFTVTDPTTAPWWRAAAERRLLVQRCETCGGHQFYPRPFCLSCQSRDVAWVPAAGTGRVYSLTTVRVPVVSWLTPPYVVALVELDEGPRLLTNLVGPPCRVGDRVEVCWDVRDDLLVPLFTASTSEGKEGR